MKQTISKGLIFTIFTLPLSGNPFFLTGDIADLVPIEKQMIPSVGKITVLTEPLFPNAAQEIGGHYAVISSVLRGFKKLKIPMNYNPKTIKEVGDHIFVLCNINALHQAIELKKNHRIKTLIVGPNILNNPQECNHILGSPEIDWYIAPCHWARICNIEEEPLTADKTAIWYAGIDVDYWKPRIDKKTSGIMLIYWKTESESWYRQIEQLLHQQGWKTVCIQYGTYTQEQYKYILDHVDAAVFISVSESQGIALAECWSMNIPTFVWNPGKAIIYGRQVDVCSAPYITSTTGYLWNSLEELDTLLNHFDELKTGFDPRKWVINYMSDEASISLLLDLIEYSYY